MPKVNFNVQVSLDMEDINKESVKVAGREIIADLNVGSLGHNANVNDIEVTEIEGTIPATPVNCMPDKEISELVAQ